MEDGHKSNESQENRTRKATADKVVHSTALPAWPCSIDAGTLSKKAALFGAAIEFRGRDGLASV
jgi:hypothetical protein